MPSKSDRRVKYTRMVLRQSLLSLMKRKSIEKISVTDICKEADINRGTFYSHYRDAYDLLQQVEDELYDGMRQALARTRSGALSTLELTQEITGQIAANSDLCKILLGKNGDVGFVKKVIALAQEPCFMMWKKKLGGMSMERYAYLFAFIANGSVALLQHWIDGNMQEPPAAVAAMIDSLASRGISAYGVSH